MIKVEREAFEQAVHALLEAANRCHALGDKWEPHSPPDHLHDLAVATVRGALSTLFNEPVFIEDEHAKGKPWPKPVVCGVGG